MFQPIRARSATVLVFCLSALAAFGVADLSTSELIKVEGSVEVRKGEAPAFKKVPSNLQLAGALKRLDGGDKVRTAVQSGAELMLKDTCVLAIKEGSLFEVPVVLGEKGLAQLKVQQGHFLFKVVTGSDFQVQTADVVAAVKGTLFEVEMTDSFQRLVGLPGVEIGHDNLGGTMVDVYEGAVDLTNPESKTTRRLEAGQGISVFNRFLMRLDKGFAGGFSDLRRFDPREQVKRNFGPVGELLGSIGSARQGFAGLETAGLKLPFQRAKLGGRLQRFSEGFAPGLREKLKGLQEKLGFLNRIKGSLQDWRDIGQAIKGEEFTPRVDEARYPVRRQPMTIPGQGLNEAHLGEGLFVAAAPGQGCAALTLTPEEGQVLTLTEGEGTIRLHDYSDGLDAVLTVGQVGGEVVTLIEVGSGELHARFAGELDPVLIKAGETRAVAFSPATGTARRLASLPAVRADPRIAGYRFLAESEIGLQRAEHDRKMTKQRLEAADKARKKMREIPRVRDMLQNLKIPIRRRR